MLRKAGCAPELPCESRMQFGSMEAFEEQIPPVSIAAVEQDFPLEPDKLRVAPTRFAREGEVYKFQPRLLPGDRHDVFETRSISAMPEARGCGLLIDMTRSEGVLVALYPLLPTEKRVLRRYIPQYAQKSVAELQFTKPKVDRAGPDGEAETS